MINIKNTDTWKRLKIKLLKYHDITSADPGDALKYSEIDFWLGINIMRFLELNLWKQKNLKILDIGCGPGFFCFICKMLGHEAIGMDRPLEYFNDSERIIYTVIPEILNVEIIRRKITEYESIILQDKFDLVTAFMVCFNKHKEIGEWGKAEWISFINDIFNYINPKGKLIMNLNANPEKYSELLYYDSNTLVMFDELGTITRPGMVIIREDKFGNAKGLKLC
ncbi:MAG: methyltransferase domain-containing protein [Desulfobaccales bacterium]